MNEKSESIVANVALNRDERIPISLPKRFSDDGSSLLLVETSGKLHEQTDNFFSSMSFFNLDNILHDDYQETLLAICLVNDT